MKTISLTETKTMADLKTGEMFRFGGSKILYYLSMVQNGMVDNIYSISNVRRNHVENWTGNSADHVNVISVGRYF